MLVICRSVESRAERLLLDPMNANSVPYPVILGGESGRSCADVGLPEKHFKRCRRSGIFSHPLKSDQYDFAPMGEE